jgi:integrase
MARRPRSTQLESRTSRLKLQPRRKPYYGAVARGIHLGYRRLKGAGSWTVKAVDGHGGHWTKVFAVADDHEAANGGTILDYWQAQDRARVIAREGDGTAGGDRPLTVSEALANYASELQSRGGDDGNVSRVRHHLPSALAAKMVTLLTPRDLRHWRDSLLKKGLAPSSADRTARILRAALTLAAREDQRISNTAWRDGLRQLPDVERPRNDILSDDAVHALVAAAYDISPEFGLWTELHAATGQRTSQLARLQISDLQGTATAPRLMVPSSKKGKRRRVDRKPVPITPALAKALRQATRDRGPDAAMMPQPGSEMTLRRLFARAVAAAGLNTKTTPYSLRHSSITRMLLAGVPVRVTASTHDTSTLMIERNYSAFITDHADVVVRRALLDIATPVGANVVPMARP